MSSYDSKFKYELHLTPQKLHYFFLKKFCNMKSMFFSHHYYSIFIYLNSRLSKSYEDLLEGATMLCEAPISSKILNILQIITIPQRACIANIVSHLNLLGIYFLGPPYYDHLCLLLRNQKMKILHHDNIILIMIKIFQCG